MTASNETDAALRRKIQRKQVILEADAEDGRTEATIWDIARLRVSRHICDIGFEAEEAFGKAKLFVGHAYRDLISGSKSFTKTAGERQDFLFIVFFKVGPTSGGGQVITVKPDPPHAGLRELALQAAQPRNVVVPIHKLILDAWYTLPDLPDDVAVWMRASSSKMDAALNSAASG